MSKTNPDVRKIGFPNVILPGEFRNDLYVTIDRGNFDRSGKTGSRNVEVTILVMDQEGQIVENCIFYASGQCGKSRSSLPILYHNNSPIWNETLRLQIPIDKFYNSHLRLEFRHCSAKDKNDKKLLGNVAKENLVKYCLVPSKPFSYASFSPYLNLQVKKFKFPVNLND